MLRISLCQTLMLYTMTIVHVSNGQRKLHPRAYVTSKWGKTGFGKMSLQNSLIFDMLMANTILQIYLLRRWGIPYILSNFEIFSCVHDSLLDIRLLTYSLVEEVFTLSLFRRRFLGDDTVHSVAHASVCTTCSSTDVIVDIWLAHASVCTTCSSTAVIVDIWSWHALWITLYGNPPVLARWTKPLLRWR